MDESYQLLLESERKRRETSALATVQRLANNIAHKLLVAAIITAFKARKAIDKIGAGIRQGLLTPLDGLLSLSYTLWSRDPSCASSTHLDITSLREAFWNGDSLVVATGWRTFFIKPRSKVLPACTTTAPVFAPDCPPAPPVPPTRRVRKRPKKWRFRQSRKPSTARATFPGTFRGSLGTQRGLSTLTIPPVKRGLKRERFRNRFKALKSP